MKLNRLQLYALSWAMPQTELAKWVDRSTSLIWRIAKDHNVPTPPGGYWGKARAGRAVLRTALPDPQDLRVTSLGIDDRFAQDLALLIQELLSVGPEVVLTAPAAMAASGRATPDTDTAGIQDAQRAGRSSPSARGMSMQELVDGSVASPSAAGRDEAAPTPALFIGSIPTATPGPADACPAGTGCELGEDLAQQLLGHAAGFAQWEAGQRFLDTLEARARAMPSPGREELMIIALQARLALTRHDPVARFMASREIAS